ncbi:MAG: hypothetical protein A2287_09270 [Candidatus Melainabacteria bacterium RIFOXYA12_FULL_32_12]|nr:MAG: hypothetical protein A2104_00735 [Candidatus Melainabacteria bacterium GWF2_32_7]OGI25681.1 MAG: hypothetical protein A2287_09270 [Candidatus Melainabacteria bacterium RIFOXYA12_FULL_32_12]
MKQNLINKIYYELDMIRLLSKMSCFVIQNEAENIKQDDFQLIFEDIEKRCWQISEFVENIESHKT